jgi:Cofilin/tropomyosin-type actin-binding protein
MLPLTTSLFISPSLSHKTSVAPLPPPPTNCLLPQPSGRLSVPYVLLYYLPANCNPNLRMSYAGAVELMRSTAEVNRVIEISDAEDLSEIEKKLQGED